MKYLLCYNTMPYGEVDKVKVISETYDSFAEAVSQYTLRCGKSMDVVLADMGEEKIIWQKSNHGSIEAAK